MKTMNDNHNNFYGFLFGMIGGFYKYAFVNIDASVLIRFAEAIVTAFFCGAVGVAGKIFFTWAYKKFKKA
jgi:hypothetical protein